MLQDLLGIYPGDSSYTLELRRTAEIFKTPPFIYSIFFENHTHSYISVENTFHNNVINVINAGEKWLYLSMFQQLRMLTTGDHLVIIKILM
jgi:hypothetical protein